MAKKTLPKGIVKDIAVVGVGVLAIWLGLYAAFGTPNPFYVVASESMVPALEVYDVLIVQGHIPFEDLEIGDIIVYDRPSDGERVIVHRVASIIDDDPRTLRTKGDANAASIPGTDFPITGDDYIGKVMYTVPDIGYVTQVIKPPINYIIIVIVIGIMIFKQMSKDRDGGDRPLFGRRKKPDMPDAGRAAEDPKQGDRPKAKESETGDQKNG